MKTKHAYCNYILQLLQAYIKYINNKVSVSLISVVAEYRSSRSIDNLQEML